MSFTIGTFVKFTRLDKIDAAKIGRVAFFDPDIDILPEIFLFPLISNFCIKEIYTFGSVTPFCFIYLPFLFA